MFYINRDMKPDADGNTRGPFGPQVKDASVGTDGWQKARARRDLRVIALGWCAMAAVGAALAIFWPSATTTTMAFLIGVAAAVVTWQVYRVIKRDTGRTDCCPGRKRGETWMT